MAAICENGHELSADASRCDQCGARIKMQWMAGSDGNKLGRAETSPSATPVSRALRQALKPVDGINLIVIGLFMAVPAGILIGVGFANPEDAPLAFAIGAIIGAISSTVVSVGTIAQGVIVGMRRVAWEQERREASKLV